MDDLPPTQHVPADHYRRRAAQAWRLAADATTPAVKQHLRDLAAQFERLAEGIERSLLRSLPADDLIGAQMVGRPLPSLGHRRGPPRVPNEMSIGGNMLYRACIKCLANCRLNRNRRELAGQAPPAAGRLTLGKGSGDNHFG
jgi:hypothetical protein